jgi:hypothetical protein
MIQPAELTMNKPLKWSPGTGVRAWKMFRGHNEVVAVLKHHGA